jgi:hypothetical protein
MPVEDKNQKFKYVFAFPHTHLIPLDLFLQAAELFSSGQSANNQSLWVVKKKIRRP